ncbi:hypothetical protein G6F24_014707 [Rhizopus arrhizus]|nr:hypothetical protein G6F24_014707 [Rhizopus arrhizus]
MRAGLKRGFSVPRAVLDGREVSIATVAELKDPTESPLYAPVKKLPNSIPAAEQARLQAQAREAISGKVVPAFQQLRTFFVSEYVPQARTTLAAEAMPDGKAYYKQQIHEYTTLDLSPDEIHRIGLGEVARIQGEMNDIIRQVKFKGSFAEFLTFLLHDAAARALHHRAGAAGHRAVLDRRPWWHGHLLAQYLQPAIAPAVQPAGADPA